MVTIGRVIGRVYKYIQSNWIYTPPNPTLIVPISSVNTTLQVTIGKISSSPDNKIQNKPSSITNFKNKLDSAVSIDEK